MLWLCIPSTRSFLKNMDTLYNVNIEVALVPVIHKTIPRITYGYDDTVINTMDLEIPCLVSLDHDFTKGTHSFWVEFLNKDYTESKPDSGIDMAVDIKSVAIHDIRLDRLKWAGKYYPEYPADYPDKNPVLQPCWLYNAVLSPFKYWSYCQCFVLSNRQSCLLVGVLLISMALKTLSKARSTLPSQWATVAPMNPY